MVDSGIDKGLVSKFNASDRDKRGWSKGFYGFRKMFWEYLNKLEVPFYDSCCVGASDNPSPVRFDSTAGSLQYFNGTTWVSTAGLGAFSTTAQNDIAAGTGGAISVTNYLTTINTDAGGDAFTLADGTVIGQQKKILLVVDGGGNAVITPVNLAAGTTITMNDATDYVILIWGGTEWFVIENFGTTIA